MKFEDNFDFDNVGFEPTFNNTLDIQNQINQSHIDAYNLNESQHGNTFDRIDSSNVYKETGFRFCHGFLAFDSYGRYVLQHVVPHIWTQRLQEVSDQLPSIVSCVVIFQPRFVEADVPDRGQRWGNNYIKECFSNIPIESLPDKTHIISTYLSSVGSKFAITIGDGDLVIWDQFTNKPVQKYSLSDLRDWNVEQFNLGN